MTAAAPELSTPDLGSPAEAATTMRRQQFFMLVTMAVRMVGGLVTFVVQARFLGPHGFGILGAGLGVASIASLLSDFGVHSFVMRRAGARPRSARSLVLDALAIKLLLTLPAALLALCWALFTDFTPVEKFACVLAVLGFFLHATGDIMFLEVRIAARMEVEARTTCWTFALMSGTVAVTAAGTASVLATATALFASRFVYLLGSMHATIGFAAIRDVARRLRRPRRLRPMLTRVRFYAVDAVLTNAASQADVVILSYLLATHSMGIYVAGSRLVQNGLPVFAMLANLYLTPLASALQRSPDDAERIARRFNREFAALALASVAGIVLAGPLAVRVVYGAQYDELNRLWPAFAVFVAARVLVGSLGIQLIAMDAITGRIAVLAGALVLMLVLLVLLVPTYGVDAAAWVLAATAMTTLLGYLLVLRRQRHRSPGITWQVVGGTILASLLLIGVRALGWGR